MNPVQQFLSGFSQKYLPALEALLIKAEENPKLIPYALQLESQWQRLQYFFMDIGELTANGENYWEGSLLSVLAGTAYINGTAEECSFVGVLSESQRLEGTIRENVMEAALNVAEEIEVPLEDDETAEIQTDWRTSKSIELKREQDGYFISIYWDQAYSTIYLSNGALYCSAEAAEKTKEDEPPEAWANWGIVNEEFIDYTETIL